MLSLAIMHIPQREALLNRILDRLSSQLRVETISAEIFTDERHQGPWPTAKRALQGCSPQASHLLLLQDDCLPCPDFLPVARELIALDPIAPTSFAHIDEDLAYKAIERGTYWIRGSYGTRTLALAIPTVMIAPFLAWSARHIPETFSHDDLRFGYYLFCHQKPSWRTAHSLVEHLGKSTQGHGRIRSASPWRDSARLIDWSIGRDAPLWVKDRPGYMKRIYRP